MYTYNHNSTGLEAIMFTQLTNWENTLYSKKRILKKENKTENADKFISDTEHMIGMVTYYYKHADNLNVEQANGALADFKKIHPKLWKIESLLKRDDYLNSKQLEENIKKLVRLSNRLISRLQSIAYSNSEPVEDPLDNIKSELVSNSNNLIADAIKEG